MAKKFPENLNYSGFDTPSRVEADVLDLEVTGEIPMEMNGTFFRVGPDPQFQPKINSPIFFNDDGMVGSFKFKDGQVDFRSRYAQTDRYRAEKEARRGLFGDYRNPYTDDPSVEGMIRGTANTAVIVHHGKLFALKEDSPALEMVPDTLETIGYSDFGGKFTSETFTAHPKIDPNNGELVAFGYSAKGVATLDTAYYVIDRNGQVVHEVWFDCPRAGFIHDFAVTENFVVFPLDNHTINTERLKAGKPAFVWQPELHQMFGVLPRRGEAKDIRWFTIPKKAFHGHTVNAWDDGTTIHYDTTLADDNVFAFFPEEGGNAPNVFDINNMVMRLTFDMSSDRTEPGQTVIAPVMAELPSIDPRYDTRPYTHAFLASIDPSKPYDFEKCGPPSPNNPFNSLMHLNVRTGEVKRWFAGPTCAVQEPVFVPKSDTAEEGEGYLVALVNRLPERLSDLVILDAQDIEAGPIATAHLPIRLRTGLHGCWMPSE